MLDVLHEFEKRYSYNLDAIATVVSTAAINNQAYKTRIVNFFNKYI
ncbi:hypothetical protein [Stanieria cyanosphaera]|nr:hypothetical protein [Stanieria cyanosphaera]